MSQSFAFSPTSYKYNMPQDLMSNLDASPEKKKKAQRQSLNNSVSHTRKEWLRQTRPKGGEIVVPTPIAPEKEPEVPPRYMDNYVQGK